MTKWSSACAQFRNAIETRRSASASSENGGTARESMLHVFPRTRPLAYNASRRDSPIRFLQVRAHCAYGSGRSARRTAASIGRSGANMSKQSAGILMVRRDPNGWSVLLVHPGGPFWAKKDFGAWSIPKGEYSAGEDPLAVAVREFEEETGVRPKGEFRPLGEVRQAGGKRVLAWAVEGDLDPAEVKSNSFEIEWPPKPRAKRSWRASASSSTGWRGCWADRHARFSLPFWGGSPPKAAGWGHFTSPHPARHCASRHPPLRGGKASQSSVRRKRVTAMVIATSIRPASQIASISRSVSVEPLSRIARTMRMKCVSGRHCPTHCAHSGMPANGNMKPDSRMFGRKNMKVIWIACS